MALPRMPLVGARLSFRQVIGVALVLGAYEEHPSTETWRTPKDCDRRYLAALTEWGYQLFDVEQLVTGEPGQ